MTCISNSTSQHDFATFIIANTVLITTFLIGLYYQVQIIISSRKERGVTWRVDMCNSIVMIFFYSFRISFEFVTNFVPVLHPYTGRWFCYMTLFINIFGAIFIISHSLVISIYKYIYIVHQDLIRYIGVNTASLASFWLSLALPLTLTVLFVSQPTIPSYSSIYNCLGMDLEKSIHVNESSSLKVKRLLFCGYDDFSELDYGVIDYFINIINMMGCSLSILVVLIIITNMAEAFFYHRIFSFIKRLVSN